MNFLLKVYAFKPTHLAFKNPNGRAIKVRLIRRDNYDNLVESRFPNWLGGLNGWITEGYCGYSVKELEK